MDKFSVEKYQDHLNRAIRHFWNTCNTQKVGGTKSDQGNRSAVTGGKQLDGFLELLVQVSKDLGVPANCIYVKGNKISRPIDGAPRCRL